MQIKAHLKDYFRSLHALASRGDATEPSYYGALSDFLEGWARQAGHADLHVTALPKQTEAGNPDFRVWNGRDRITGYVEAKRLGENLDLVEQSAQLRRYRDTFPNLILTDFGEFRLYRDGALVDRAIAGRVYTLDALGAPPPPDDAEGTARLLEEFLGFSVPAIKTAERLAVELAKRTRFLRDLLAEQLARETDEGRGTLLGFYHAFQKYLMGHLDPDQFADLYAQTVTYGLFAARTRARDGFSRRSAFDNIPHTIGILRDVFRFISLGKLPDQVEWIVDDIAHVLAVTDAGALLDRYYREGKGADPVVHFYETFLAEYDPAERERRGVYYTPEEVVGYIVRSLHAILKAEFGMADGLADPAVTLLDPAAGTMTFVARACRQAVEERRKYGGGGIEQFIREHVLEHFYAFELMMAPYAVGHLKMGFLLEEMGHRLEEDERLPFYLTNTLEMAELEQTELPGMASLAEESRLAGQVKRQEPILVVLGNPPYSGHSANKGEWITGKIADYRQVDGQPLGERNPKWLQDDYVKFLRFAQWKIEQAGRGVVGMITNHSYLDNPTFRGMRWSLMRTFDQIHVLDLHGSSLKRERCPDGSPDENVFDIRQGVAIAFFVKRGEGEGQADVRHAELWGSRDRKRRWLEAHDVGSTDWEEASAREAFYLFVPRDEAALERYNQFASVTDLFPLHGVGIVTSRDAFVTDFAREALERRIRQFLDPNMPDEVVRRAFKLRDKKHWSLAEARSVLRADDGWRDKIVRCLYRPFDRRWLLYHPALIERDRQEVMRHMLPGDNVALITCRQLSSATWQHALVSDGLTDDCMVSNRTRERGYVLPLYGPGGAVGAREPNLPADLLPALGEAYGREVTPEEVFGYIYAVLYAPSYREKYAEFLKTDFPRVPFTADAEAFAELAERGRRLLALHLLDSPELDPPIARFEGEGDGRVARTKAKGFRYEPARERVCVNQAQHFAPVPEEVWQYQVGGYQVCHKWLKDRRERRLGAEDVRTYCRIVTALARTIEIQEEIDALYPAAERDVLDLRP